MTRIPLTRRAALALVAGLAAGAAQAADAGHEDPLAEFLWTARPLVIFANNALDPRLLRQLRDIEGRQQDLDERDVVVIVDTTPGPSRFDDTPLRMKFRPHDFNVILVGKDGEVKKRSPSPVSGAQLVRMIDRLPLRQEELGRR